MFSFVLGFSEETEQIGSFWCVHAYRYVYVSREICFHIYFKGLAQSTYEG